MVTAIIVLLCTLLVFLLGNRAAYLFLQSTQHFPRSLTDALNQVVPSILQKPFFLSRSGAAMVTGFCCAFAVVLIWISQKANQKKYRHGEEYGSARWGTKKDLSDLIDKNPEQNILLSKWVRISMDTRKLGRNNNHVLVIGGSGTGKTRFFLKPNLMQMHSSYAITDPKGEVLASCGKMLADHGYKVRVLNLVEMAASDSYNPFVYLRPGRDEDVMSLIRCIMENTTPSGQKSSDPFWEKAEMLFLQAICFYIVYEAPPAEQNFSMVMELIRAGDVRDNADPEYQSPLDILFAELSDDHIAKMQYEGYKQAAGKTAQSIVISAYARLAPFNIASVAKLTATDTISLDTLGTEKTALFIIISPADTTFNFIAAMMYSQLFMRMDYIANWKYHGSLPVPIRMLFDEFANIGKIPDFEKILAYARSLNIGITPIFQSLSQLKEMYEKSWEGIVDNCESLLFLGGQGVETAKYISEKLGKTTIDSQNNSKSFGKDKSYSQQYQKLGRELLLPDEINKLPENKCIVFAGKRPFLSRKYDIKKHPRYKLLGDYRPSNRYDIMNRTPSVIVNDLPVADDDLILELVI